MSGGLINKRDEIDEVNIVWCLGWLFGVSYFRCREVFSLSCTANRLSHFVNTESLLFDSFVCLCVVIACLNIYAEQVRRSPLSFALSCRRLMRCSCAFVRRTVSHSVLPGNFLFCLCSRTVYCRGSVRDDGRQVPGAHSAEWHTTS